MFNIALFLEFTEGHHPTYLRYYSKALLELGCNLVVFCQKSDQLKKWIQSCNKIPQQSFTVIEYGHPVLGRFVPDLIKPKLLVLHRWKNASTALKAYKQETGFQPDLVFFLCLDAYLDKRIPSFLVDLVFPFVWSGLYLAPAISRGDEKTQYSALPFLCRDESLLSSHCRTVGVLDDGMAYSLVKITGKPVIVFPDIAELFLSKVDFLQLTELIHETKGRKVVGLFGCLAKRKGILTLLAVSQRMTGEDVLFLFAGPLDESSFTDDERILIESFVTNPPVNCIFFLESFHEEHFNSLLESCDIIYLVYEKFSYSSNILTKAAYFKKPVIVTEGYCMAERVIKYRLGAVVKENHPEESERAIRTLVANLPVNDCSGFEEYYSNHTEGRLRECFESVIGLTLQATNSIK